MKRTPLLVLVAAVAGCSLLPFSGEPDPATPASLVRSASGTTVALLDRTAASRLPA